MHAHAPDEVISSEIYNYNYGPNPIRWVGPWLLFSMCIFMLEVLVQRESCVDCIRVLQVLDGNMPA